MNEFFDFYIFCCLLEGFTLNSFFKLSVHKLKHIINIVYQNKFDRLLILNSIFISFYYLKVQGLN
jgi:hypothetical protein